MMNYSDNQLIIAYLDGDQQSLDILIKRYLKPIYNFIRYYIGNSAEAEDITQDVFMRAWRNLDKFDQDRSFKTWLFSIAKYASIDWLKKKKTLPFVNFEDAEGRNTLIETLIDESALPEDFLRRLDVARIVNSAIKEISVKYRQVLLLHYYKQLNFREIAEILEESLNTVKSWHRRALIHLRKILAEN